MKRKLHGTQRIRKGNYKEATMAAGLVGVLSIPLTRWAVRHWPTTTAGNNDSEPPPPQLIGVADAEQHS